MGITGSSDIVAMWVDTSQAGVKPHSALSFSLQGICQRYPSFVSVIFFTAPLGQNKRLIVRFKYVGPSKLVSI